MRVPPELVSRTLGMYYDGLSLSDISRNLQEEYGYYPSKSVIYRWIDKFTNLAIEKTKDYQPQVGDTWIADETVIEIDGKNIWLFDCIDSKTRFLLATRLAYSRTTHDAYMLMKEASKKAGKIPKIVVTDKLRSYLDGIEMAFGADTEHIQSRPFTVKDSTNLIERFHGTLKERTKVMRGLKDIGTAMQFIDGFLINYNYLKIHEGLKGKTPAQVAKIDYPYRTWSDIIRQPVTREPKITPQEPAFLKQQIPKQVRRAIGMDTDIPKELR